MREPKYTKRDVAGMHVMLGIMLFLSPGILGFAEAGPAALSAWLTGAVISTIALGALKQPAWAFGGNLIMSVWTIMAPWNAGFASEPAGLWSHLTIGIILGATAAAGLIENSGSGPTVAA